MMIASMPTFATLLHAYRIAAGLSQAQLAERANVSVGAIGSLEQGLRKSPYPHTVHCISDALDLDAEERALLLEIAKSGRRRKPEHDKTRELVQLLTEGRTITVTGAAGAGKTRNVSEVIGELISWMLTGEPLAIDRNLQL